MFYFNIFAVAGAAFTESALAVSPIATDRPACGFCTVVMPAGALVPPVKTVCAMLPSVMNNATTATAFSSGMNRCVMLIVRALTGCGSSTRAIMRASKSSPRTSSFTSECS